MSFFKLERRGLQEILYSNHRWSVNLLASISNEVVHIFFVIDTAPPYITEKMQIFIDKGGRTELFCQDNSTDLSSDIQWLKQTIVTTFLIGHG